MRLSQLFLFFFFNDTATTEIYTLSLHDALPIWPIPAFPRKIGIVTSPKSAALRDILTVLKRRHNAVNVLIFPAEVQRSEEHTSELQSPCNLVCRLLLEKKKKSNIFRTYSFTQLN